jgi:VanZ family protein
MLNKTLPIISVAATVALLYYSWIPFAGTGGPEPPSGNPVHLIAFFAYSVVILVTASRFTSTRKSAVAAFLLSVAVGAITELGQLFIPGRFCDPADWLVDAAGTAVGIAVALLVQYLLSKRAGNGKHIKHNNKVRQ